MKHVRLWQGAIDPVTGDRLTALEAATRQTQLVLRSPWFILAFNVVTLVMMLFGWREGWNYLASWLAIMVEWIVGTFMFGQTKRDAQCIREIRTVARHVEALSERLLIDVEAEREAMSADGAVADGAVADGAVADGATHGGTPGCN